MRKSVKKLSIQTIGFFFLLLGIAGLILPVLNGIVFLILGLLLLSLYSPWAKELLKKAGKTHPTAQKTVEKLEKLVVKYVGEIEM
jgi:uncharacterized membrane protein YbaN (DUF454 family)